MKIELIELSGFESALKAMRLPKKSGERADSKWIDYLENNLSNEEWEDGQTLKHTDDGYNVFRVGDKDLELAKRLIKAGDEHAKSIRGVVAYLKIQAPRFWWVEMDTYRIGCECLSSESTMHTILSDNLTINDFLWEDGNDREELLQYIEKVRKWKQRYSGIELKRKIKKHLPESFLQTRIKWFTYQTLKRIDKQRYNHQLIEWKQFCEFNLTLPLMKEFIR